MDVSVGSGSSQVAGEGHPFAAAATSAESSDQALLQAIHKTAAAAMGPLCVVLGVCLLLEGTTHLLADGRPSLLVAAPVSFAIALFTLRARASAVARRAGVWMLVPWASIIVNSATHVFTGSDPTMSLVLGCALLVGVGAMPLTPIAFLIAMATTTLSSAWLAWLVGGATALPAVAGVAVVTWFSRRTRMRAARDELHARALAQALSQREAEVERLDQLASMAAGVAHHANNQLAGILGGASLLAGRFFDDPEAREDIRIIEGSAQALAETIGALRTYAEIGREPERELREFANVDVEDLLDRQQLERSLAPGMRLEIEIADDLPAIRVAPERLRHALTELVRNASDASRVTGASEIRIRAAHRPDGSLELAVHDRGEGMDPDTARRLTNPFRTNREPTRRGLGLSVALATAHMLGGSLDFRRSDDETVVAIMLPATAAV